MNMNDIQKFRDIFDEVHIFTEKHIEVGEIGDRLEDFIRDFFNRKENEIKIKDSNYARLKEESEELFKKYYSLIDKLQKLEEKLKISLENTLKMDDIKTIKF